MIINNFHNSSNNDNIKNRNISNNYISLYSLLYCQDTEAFETKCRASKYFPNNSKTYYNNSTYLSFRSYANMW